MQLLYLLCIKTLVCNHFSLSCFFFLLGFNWKQKFGQSDSHATIKMIMMGGESAFVKLGHDLWMQKLILDADILFVGHKF